MAIVHTNSTRKSRTHSRHRLKSNAFLGTAIGLGLTGHALAAPPPPQSARNTLQRMQTNDFLLKMLLESLIQLINEVEIGKDGWIRMDTPKETLQEAADALVWGYANLGVDENLPALMIVQGIDDCQEALDLIHDASEPPQLPPSLLNLLDTAVEGMADDLEEAI